MDWRVQAALDELALRYQKLMEEEARKHALISAQQGLSLELRVHTTIHIVESSGPGGVEKNRDDLDVYRHLTGRALNAVEQLIKKRKDSRRYMDEVAALNPTKFYGIRNFGASSFNEIKTALVNLKLINVDSPWWNAVYKKPM